MPRLNAQSPELTPEEYELIHGWEPRTKYQRAMAGLFQPFADAFKDLKNTFKPYKGTYQSTNDFLQPIYGIGNLIQSAGYACATGLGFAFSPIVLLIGVGWLSYNFLFSEDTKKSNQEWAMHALSYLKEMLLERPTITINFALRGITQLVFTPLTWLIKMPLRGLITLIVGSPKIEDSESVQNMLKQGNDILSDLIENNDGMVDVNQTSMPVIIKALRYKMHHGCEKGRSTNLTDTQKQEAQQRVFHSSLWQKNSETGQFEDKYKLASKETLSNYLTLFSQKNDDTTTEEKSIIHAI